MDLKNFDYELPRELIAQKPLMQRDQSRLMIIGEKIEHKKFCESIEYLQKDDVLVINTSKVIPAKLTGTKETGGKVSILLLKKISDKTWECLAQGNKLHGKTINFGEATGTIIHEKHRQTITFVKDVSEMLQLIGEAPLPPYIQEKATIERYNTVYAEKEGSVAAPTAGLHFTEDLLESIRQKGVKIAPITLHVGLGTFLPVKTKRVEEHEMHAETFTVSKETAEIINQRKGRLFCVGTTTIRALESATNSNGIIKPLTGETSLFVLPGYKWKLQYAGLFTNFHLPKSTLLMLVMAFLTPEKIKLAYEVAIKERYRFYSFGDATLLLR